MVTKEAYVKAATVLAEKVYNPIFFSKLAQYGITPNNREEAEQLLKLASQLRYAAEQNFGNISADPVDQEAVDGSLRFIRDNKDVKTAALTIKEGGA